MAAISEGICPNFHEAFTQLHLGQLLASNKCVSGDRRDGGVDQKADHIVRNFRSPITRVDEDVGICRHEHAFASPSLRFLPHTAPIFWRVLFTTTAWWNSNSSCVICHELTSDVNVRQQHSPALSYSSVVTSVALG